MSNVRPTDFETYLAMVKSSVGADIWRHGMAIVDGELKDINNNGELSCAFYVSTILKIFDAIDRYHANMDSTIKDMEETGWKKVKEPEVGDVIFWGPKLDGEKHDHAGFYIGKGRAVTNNYLRSKPELGGTPEIIDWKYKDHPDGVRELKAIYRGQHLFRH